MVRINLINPKHLADQHLIAEYDEILMLIAYVKNYPKMDCNSPNNYVLGKGHILFFKNKLKYLKKRHEELKKEMKKRGFATRKTINLNKFPKNLCKDYKPTQKDKEIIKERLIKKIKLKSTFYRYYSKHKPERFFIELIKKAD